MLMTSSAGKPTVSKTMTIVTSPACGIPAAPILAAVAVTLQFKPGNTKSLSATGEITKPPQFSQT